MKKLLIITLFLSSTLQSQSDYARLMVEQIQVMLYQYDSTSKVRLGFMDASGKIVIEPKYVGCFDFKDGIANVIRTDGTYGIIDKSGKESWFPGYEKVYFSGNLGMAGKSGKWGFINKKGKVVIPLQYEMALPFNEGYAPVKVNGRWEYIDEKGRYLLKGKYYFAGTPTYKGKFVFVKTDTVNSKEVLRKGLLNKNGKILVPAVYDNIISISAEGLCWVEKNGKSGVVGPDGREIIPCEYRELNWDSESNLIGVKENNLWGFWNKEGERVISPTYNRVYFFSEGLSAVEKEGKIGFIDEKNNIVIPFQFAPFWDYQFEEGFSSFKSDTGKFGFINKKGEIVIPARYNTVVGFKAGLGYVKAGDRAGFVDKNGTEVIPLAFDEVWNVSEGLIRFAVSKK